MQSVNSLPNSGTLFHLMLLFNRPELHIQHDAELNFIRTSWTGMTGTAYLRSCAAYLTELVQSKQAQYYLMDLSHLDDISVPDQIWLSTTLLPSVEPLPLKRVVMLLDENRIHNKMAVDSIVATEGVRFHFDIQYFNEPRTALRWLTDDSPRVPDLLAEWDASFPLVSVRHPLHAALGN